MSIAEMRLASGAVYQPDEASGPVVPEEFRVALVGAIFALASHCGLPNDEVRSLTFFCLVLSIVGLIFVHRSFSASIVTALKRRNRALQLVLIGVTTILALTLAVPMVRELFRFGPLHTHDLTITAGCGILVFLILDLFKLSIFGRLRRKAAAT